MSQENELIELKKKAFKVANYAIKFAIHEKGKGTILENKDKPYLEQLVKNLSLKSKNFNKLDVKSPDFNLFLSKSKKVKQDIVDLNYSPQVRAYINTVAYMFEGELKSIAKPIEPEKEEVVEQVEEIKQRELKCTCGKTTNLSDEDLQKFGRIESSKIIKCECGEIILTLLKAGDRRKSILTKMEKEEEEMNMELLDELNELD